MAELLKASFSNEQIQLALAIGQQEGETRDKIPELFARLDDPLLAPANVKELLGINESVEYVNDLMNELVAESLLEKSTTTQRPLDDKGISLYRQRSHAVVRLKLVAMDLGCPTDGLDISSRAMGDSSGRSPASTAWTPLPARVSGAKRS